MNDNQFEGTVCLVMATLVLASAMFAPKICPLLSFLSLLGLSVYYLVIDLLRIKLLLQIAYFAHKFAIMFRLAQRANLNILSNF